MIMIIARDLGPRERYFAYLFDYEQENFYLVKDGSIADWRTSKCIIADVIYFKSIRELLSILSRHHTFYNTNKKRCNENWQIKSVKITSKIQI